MGRTSRGYSLHRQGGMMESMDRALYIVSTSSDRPTIERTDYAELYNNYHCMLLDQIFKHIMDS